MDVPPWQTCCTKPPSTRLLREGRATARLVGLVRGLPECAAERQHPSRGIRRAERYMAEAKHIVISPTAS